MNSSTEAQKRSLAGKRILVTGATGFIGSHLTRKLVEIGCHVTIMARASSNYWRIDALLDQLEIVQCDLNSFSMDELKAKLSGTEVVFHLAAAGVNQACQDHFSTVQANVMGTHRLLQLSHLLKVKRFVYCGSCSEYKAGTLLTEERSPQPSSEYGASKAAAWILTNTFFQRYGLPTVSLRPFTAYGPFEARHRLIPHTILNTIKGQNIELTGGNQTRDFIFIEDVVDAFLLAAISREAVGNTFNVCSGIETSIKDVVSSIINLCGGGSRPLFGSLPYRDTEEYRLSGNPTRAKNILGWVAKTPLDNGLRETIKWFYANRMKSSTYSYG